VGFMIAPVRVTPRRLAPPQSDRNSIITTPPAVVECVGPPATDLTPRDYQRAYARKRIAAVRCRHCGACRGCGRRRRRACTCGRAPVYRHRCVRCQRREARRWRKAYPPHFNSMKSPPERHHRKRLVAFGSARAAHRTVKRVQPVEADDGAR